MSSSYPILSSRARIPHILSDCASCRAQLEFDVPLPLPKASTLLQIRCYQCQAVASHTFYPAQVASGSIPGASRSQIHSTASSQAPPPPPRKSRKIGTQERPLETTYYDTLDVPVTATTDEIKKAYRRLAIKHHPDKNPNDPGAEARFKEIAIAYQTLSDDALRKKYNEYGSKEAAGEETSVDPEAVFSAMFGGDRFAPIIGTISLGQEMKSALQEDDEDEDGNPKTVVRDAKGKIVLSEAERAKKEEKERKISAEKAQVRKDRIQKLVEHLERKLSIFTESATGPNDPDVTQSWRTICELEAEELKRESYGVELLNAIGFVYASKAKHHLATNQTFLGVGGWLHNVQGKYHVFSETVSTIRSAIELKGVFEQLQAAEKAGNLSPEEKKKLEDTAAEKGLQALFKGAKLEIESVLRETSDRILEDPAVSRQKATMRAMALQILGEAYMGVKKGDELSEEDEYVRIESQKSREREKHEGGV